METERERREKKESSQRGNGQHDDHAMYIKEKDTGGPYINRVRYNKEIDIQRFTAYSPLHRL
jgi:hypothetical protein